VFGDEVLVAAIRDRLLHHSHTILIQDDSYRLKQKRKSGLLYPTLLRANSSLATAEPKAHQQQCQAARTLDAPLGVAARTLDAPLDVAACPAQACTGPPKPAPSVPGSLGSQHVPRETLQAPTSARLRGPSPSAAVIPPRGTAGKHGPRACAETSVLATMPSGPPRHPAERRGAMCSGVSCSGPDQPGARRVLYLFQVNTPAHFVLRASFYPTLQPFGQTVALRVLSPRLTGNKCQAGARSKPRQEAGVETAPRNAGPLAAPTVHPPPARGVPPPSVK